FIASPDIVGGPWRARITYWKAGQFLGQTFTDPEASLFFLNCWELDPWDNFQEGADEIRAEVLDAESSAITERRSYKVLPSCIYSGLWFRFLNDLGTWDSIAIAADVTRQDRPTWTISNQ